MLKISKKNHKRVFDRGKGELDNAKGREHKSIFTFKMASLECFHTVFYNMESRALFCLQKKMCCTVNISSRHPTLLQYQG